MLNDFGGFPNLLSYKIFLDRYAAKDEKRNIRNGDLVLCLMDPREGVGKREIGIVINDGKGPIDPDSPLGENEIEVKLHTGFDIVGGEKRSLDGETRIFNKSRLDKPIELTAEQLHKRVATAVSLDTDGTLNVEKYKNYMHILNDWSFVPAGRLLSGLGFQDQLTLFNCYTLPSPKDSREGINNTLGLMTELMARGGGVGINLSSLRPRNTIVRGVRGRSSGAVSWGDEYSRRTGRVEQGGSRRGSLLLMLADWHPDIIEFIEAKRQSRELKLALQQLSDTERASLKVPMENCNISVAISNTFMKAVEDDTNWTLEFPDTTTENYTELWDGDLKSWKESGCKTIVYKTMKARELWNILIKSSWESGEPGIIFLERYNDLSNTNYYPEGKIVVTNPCITGDVLITTNKGLIRLKDIVQNFNIKDDLCVLSADGEFHKITNAFSNGHKEVIAIHLCDGSIIKATENHEFLANNSWVATKDLHIGDKLTLSFSSDKKHQLFFPYISKIDKQEKNEEVFDLTIENSHNYTANNIIVHNCGEQGLPAHGKGIGVCNLGHLNLPKFLKSDFVDFSNLELHEAYNYVKDQVDWEKLENTVRLAVQFLDHIYDIATFLCKEHANSALGERRIGLGTIGLAEMLIRLGITYGDNKLCLEFIDTLYNFIQIKAYDESMRLAEKFGAYTFCNCDKLVQTYMIKKLGIQHKILNYGMRNATLTTQAPTGTVGTMLNTSTGVEPFPFFEWTLQTNIGEHESTASVLHEWCEKHNDQDVPEFFVSSMGPRAIRPEDHAAIQTTIQKWTDSSISKTCNLPHHATVEDVAKFFTYLYTHGAKGGTVYRDGCRDKQVLNSIQKAKVEKEDIIEDIIIDKEDYRTAPTLIGKPAWAVSINTAMGRMHVIISFYKGPYEVFILIGKAGSELYSHCEALGRLVSAFLQLNSHVPPVNRLRKLFKHLKDIGGSNQFGVGPKKVKSIPDGVGKAIELFLEEHPDGVLSHCNEISDEESEMTVEHKPEFDICPQCGSSSLMHESGCEACVCGYSRC